MQSIRRRQGLAVVVAVGVVAAAASACGPEPGAQASDRSGAVAATVAPVAGLPSAEPASAPSATASASSPPTATASAAATTSATATTSTPTGTPTAAATRATPGPAAPSVPPTAPAGAAGPGQAAKTPAGAAPRPGAATPSPRTAPNAGTDTDNGTGTGTGNAAPDRSAGGAEALSLRLINEERVRNGVPALVVKADLTAFAEKWARHMRETGFAHSENASGAGPSLTGSRTLTGECIVMWGDAAMTGEQAAVQFQRMWTESPGHHAAQINPRYKEIGVGLFHDSSGWWGVHEFAG
ncbi:CAP domain-containing protein [Kitasatospora sp. A2-31]|uniref:CAP domain-containing protein n=1 Tax=Kitasatospora sp. A2-31 TaxID=2916414 RepID=UPI001EEDB86B|nr:CAP domain-containing protein [Kitasatospora sp. A2-31]MCG6499305.1 CAP domain-containing protein [Kitasatospora sp. A2-31]